jgi:hypothetical protein
MASATAIANLAVPPQVQQVLGSFVEAAQKAFGANLRSVVLYGSAAEGRLRATSDVNLIVVLRAFDAAQASALREPLRVAQAAIALRPMFLLESEIAQAADAFAQKFDDIAHRRIRLFGDDPFAALQISPEALRRRLRQTLLNLSLRLRAGYVARSLREEQAALMVAEAAGPLRSAAAALLELQGRPAASPKAALEMLAQELGESPQTLAHISQIRETRAAPPGAAPATLFRLIELSRRLQDLSEIV